MISNFLVDILMEGPFNGFKTAPNSSADVVQIFGKTSMGVTNEIMFPLSIFISMVVGIKCVMIFISNSSSHTNSKSRLIHFIVFVAKLIYVTSAFYGKVIMILCISIIVTDFQLPGYVDFLCISSIIFFLPTLIFFSPLARHLGYRNFIRLILQNPAILVLPYLTDFVFAPLDGYGRLDICGCNCLSRCFCWINCIESFTFDKSKKLAISPGMSWAKMCYSLIFLLTVYFLLVHGFMEAVRLDYAWSYSYWTIQIIYVILVLLGVIGFAATIHAGSLNRVVELEVITKNDKSQIKRSSSLIETFQN